MVNCFVFFSDPLMVGKVSELISRVSDEVKIHKVIDPKQLTTVNKENTSHPLIVTDYANHQVLEFSNVNESEFDRLIIIDEVESENDGNISYINKKFLVTNLATAIYDFILQTHGDADYIPVAISKFQNGIEYCTDLFIKLGQFKFLKVINEKASFDENLLDKLKSKGVNFLFVERKNYEKFNQQLLGKKKELFKKVDKSKAEISAIESLHNFIGDLGFDPKVVNMTKKIHSQIQEKYSHKFMKKLLDLFSQMEGSFLYNHSYLTSVIALTTGNRFTWMNYENREKIYLGCVLHDLGYQFKENALRESLGKKEIAKLPPSEQADILEHPIRFARHLGQIDNIHQDVIKMVRDHHGVHEDNSYPKVVYPPEVNLLFALFIVSHEFALGLYSISFREEKIPELLEGVCEKFNKGNYRKIIPEFKKAMEETFIQQAA